MLLVRLSPVDLSSANGFGKPFAASKLQKSMMEVLNLKRAAKIVLIGVCFGLILLFLKISFRIDDAAFMHGYWIAAVEITPSRVPTVAIVIPEEYRYRNIGNSLHNTFLFTKRLSVFFIPFSKQNCIIYSGTQLDGTDNNLNL